MNSPAATRSAIEQYVTSLGIHRMGVTTVTSLEADFEHYSEFLRKGMHGTMDWLERYADVRRTMGPDILANARSVIVLALSYHRNDDTTGMQDASIARYARGRDYHNFFRKKLRSLAQWLCQQHPEHQARAMVDTAPVLERAWAARAGVGFVGKNGCIIVPGMGSYVLLGEVVTTLELESDAPMEPRCGRCTLCLDACPTQAFPAPYVLDARRCVSYLTIEHTESIDPSLRAQMGNWLFGCDVCQEVCPYNRTSPPDAHTTAPFAPDPTRLQWTLETLLTQPSHITEAQLHASPLARAGAHMLARNAAIALGNTGTRRHLPVLQHTQDSHPHALVRESAQWAIQQIAARNPTSRGRPDDV